MNYFKYLLVLLLSLIGVYAQDNSQIVTSRYFAVMISAQCNSEPIPSITLSWQKNDLAYQYQIYRKYLLSDNFIDQPIAILDSLTLTFTDKQVKVGDIYEYEIRAISKGSYQNGNNVDSLPFIGFGYIAAGINIPSQDNYGWVLILVDESMMCKECLLDEILRLKDDMKGEGWGVEVIPVPRAEQFDGEKVKQVKSIIMNEYTKKNRKINALFLIGRVPVPYSGDLNPDAHPNHLGA